MNRLETVAPVTLCHILCFMVAYNLSFISRDGNSVILLSIYIYIYLLLNHKEATKLQQNLKVEPSFILRRLYGAAILFISL